LFGQDRLASGRHAGCPAGEGLVDNKRVYFLDINDAFLNDDGALTRETMPDLLHPYEKGYQLWAEAIAPTVAELMGE
jgi:lysophospholipase L1-like esterase